MPVFFIIAALTMFGIGATFGQKQAERAHQQEAQVEKQGPAAPTDLKSQVVVEPHK